MDRSASERLTALLRQYAAEIAGVELSDSDIGPLAQRIVALSHNLGDIAGELSAGTSLYGAQCGHIARVVSRMIDAYIEACMRKSDTDPNLN